MKNTFLLILACTFSLQAQQQTLNLSLSEAVEYASKNAYSVIDKELEVEKARQTINETRAMGLPQISAAFDHQYNPQIPQQPIPAEFFGGPPGTFTTVAFGVKHQNVASLTLNQLLFDATYLVALRAARVVKEDAALKLEKSQIEAQAQVAKAYYAVLITGRNEEYLMENVKSLERNLFEVQQLFENGFVEEQDVDQLVLLVNQLQSQLDEVRRQKDIARLLLKFNLGVGQQTEIILTDNLEDLLMEEKQAEAVIKSSFTLDQHIDYRSLLAQEKGANLQLTYDRMAFVPKLRGFVRHSQSNFANDFSETFSFDSYWIPGTVIGVGLSWDIFNGGARFARSKTASLDLERIEIAKELTRNQLELQYAQSRSNYAYALENYKTQQRNVEISEKIRDKTRIKYKEGLASSLELTQAENQYLEAQGNFTQALLNLMNSKEELQLALGK